MGIALDRRDAPLVLPGTEAAIGHLQAVAIAFLGIHAIVYIVVELALAPNLRCRQIVLLGLHAARDDLRKLRPWRYLLEDLAILADTVLHAQHAAIHLRQVYAGLYYLCHLSLHLSPRYQVRRLGRGGPKGILAEMLQWVQSHFREVPIALATSLLTLGHAWIMFKP